MNNKKLRVLTEAGDIAKPIIRGAALDLDNNSSFAGFVDIHWNNGELGQIPTFNDDYTPPGFEDIVQSVPLTELMDVAKQFGAEINA